ncbi:MAG: biotin/lipoate A/B protein ligase family protein [Chloroflexota bacterium]
MSQTWRLLPLETMGPAENMAVDEAIMIAHRAGRVPPTLRFYAWNPPTLSLGYSQSFAREVDRDACERHGVAWVRRPTGGRAVLHHRELTYSVVVSEALLPGGILPTYLKISSGLLRGLRACGVDAALTAPGLKEHDLTAACFDAPSAYELTVDGRKLVGSAQVRRDGVILQHGSILTDFDADLLASVLRVRDEESRPRLARVLESRAISLRHVLGHEPEWGALADAIAAGVAAEMDLELVPGALTAEEGELARELARDKYGTAAWNEMR